MNEAPPANTTQIYNHIDQSTTVLDILNALDDESTNLIMDTSYFNYSKVGGETKQEQSLPKFLPVPNQCAKITNMIFGRTKASVSIQVILKGKIELPENEFELTSIPHDQFKTYNIVRDGKLVVESLPLVVSDKVLDTLQELDADFNFIVPSTENRHDIVINLAGHEIINRAETNASLVEYKKLIKESYEVRGKIKGLKYCLKDTMGDYTPPKNKYDEDSSDWLRSIGITSKDFNPKLMDKEKTDTYYSTELECKIKGLSSLASGEAVRKKYANNKPYTLSEYLVSVVMAEGLPCNDVILQHSITDLNAKSKAIDYELSKIIHEIVVNDTWFVGAELEDGKCVHTDEIDFDGLFTKTITITKVKKEIKI